MLRDPNSGPTPLEEQCRRRSNDTKLFRAPCAVVPFHSPQRFFNFSNVSAGLKSLTRPALHPPTLLIAILAAGLVIGARWWSSVAPRTGGGDRTETDAASLESRAPRLSGSLPNPAAPKPATRAVQKRDALLESLRSKLEAANVVAGEVLLTFRSEEARDRFAKQTAAYGLEILETIPQLNTARVERGLTHCRCSHGALCRRNPGRLDTARRLQIKTKFAGRAISKGLRMEAARSGASDHFAWSLSGRTSRKA